MPNQKSQEQILQEILELVGMVPELKGTPIPEILKLMVNEEFVDTGIPVTEDLKVIGPTLDKYQKAVMTLFDRTAIECNVQRRILKDENPDSMVTQNVALKITEKYLKGFKQLFWASVYQTHAEYINVTETQPISVQGFLVAMKQSPVCTRCEKTGCVGASVRVLFMSVAK